jgi:hypothetical protein
MSSRSSCDVSLKMARLPEPSNSTINWIHHHHTTTSVPTSTYRTIDYPSLPLRPHLGKTRSGSTRQKTRQDPAVALALDHQQHGPVPLADISIRLFPGGMGER